MVGARTTRRGERNWYKISVQNLEWKRPLVRSKRQLEDNIKTDFKNQSGQIWTG
jgi:hypothetical protein